MGRSPCCDHDQDGVKKGPWTPEEDQKLMDYIELHGHGSWRSLPKLAGLNRCGKSCRLRWTNYLRPDIKRGKFSEEEERIIINLHSVLGNKWSKIATHLQGRTDNEIKNFWNTHVRKKLLLMGIDPSTHMPRTDHINHLLNFSNLLSNKNFGNNMVPTPSEHDHNTLNFQANAAHLATLQLLQNLLIMQVLSTTTNTTIPNMQNLNPLQNTMVKITGQEFANSGILPGLNQASSSYISSPDNIEGFKSINTGLISSSTTSINNLEEDTNPPLLQLVSGSSNEQFRTIINQSYSKINTDCVPTDLSPYSSNDHVFETWENFLNEEENGLYWKDILESTL